MLTARVCSFVRNDGDTVHGQFEKMIEYCNDVLQTWTWKRSCVDGRIDEYRRRAYMKNSLIEAHAYRFFHVVRAKIFDHSTSAQTVDILLSTFAATSTSMALCASSSFDP